MIISLSYNETPRAAIFSSVLSDIPSLADKPCLIIYFGDIDALVTTVNVLTPTLDFTR